MWRKKREPSFTVSGNVNWCSHCRKQYGGSSKITNSNAIWSSNFTTCIYPKKMKALIKKDICTPYIHCSIIYINSQDIKATQVSIHRWMDKEDSGLNLHLFSKFQFFPVPLRVGPAIQLDLCLSIIVYFWSTNKDRMFWYMWACCELVDSLNH